MNNNFIPKQRKQNLEYVSKLKEKQNNIVANKEKKEGIYVAIAFFITMLSLMIFFWSDNVMLDNLSLSLFIISCLLLFRFSGLSKQV